MAHLRSKLDFVPFSLPVCDYPMARNLIQFAVALASEAVVRFVLEDQQQNYSFTLRDLQVAFLEN